jgi:hypothetical protein
MKLKAFLIGLICLAMVPFTTFAANTTTAGSSLQVIQIVFDGSTDWSWETEIEALGLSSGVENRLKQAPIVAIVFYPSAANDRMVINDSTENGAAYFDSGIVTGDDDPRIIHYELPRNVALYIDADDYTLGTPANAKVLIFVEYN